MYFLSEILYFLSEIHYHIKFFNILLISGYLRKPRLTDKIPFILGEKSLFSPNINVLKLNYIY